MKKSNTLIKKNNDEKIHARDFWFNPHVAEKSAAIMVRETIESRRQNKALIRDKKKPKKRK